VEVDAIAVGILFAAGIVVAPIAILLGGACWWRRRLKWATVAMFTSWFGLWLFLRDEARRNVRQADGSATRST